MLRRFVVLWFCGVLDPTNYNGEKQFVLHFALLCNTMYCMQSKSFRFTEEDIALIEEVKIKYRLSKDIEVLRHALRIAIGVTDSHKEVTMSIEKPNVVVSEKKEEEWWDTFPYEGWSMVPNPHTGGRDVYYSEDCPMGKIKIFNHRRPNVFVDLVHGDPDFERYCTRYKIKM